MVDVARKAPRGDRERSAAPRRIKTRRDIMPPQHNGKSHPHNCKATAQNLSQNGSG